MGLDSYTLHYLVCTDPDYGKEKYCIEKKGQ